MLVIRLFRIGKKNQPSFKIVVTDKKNPPRGGRFVEEVGTYNPVTKGKTLKQERLKYWVSQGAQPSATVHNLLVKEGILQDKKIPVHKKPKKKEETTETKEAFKAEAAAPQEAAVPVEQPKEAPKEEKKEEAAAEASEEQKIEEKPQEAPKEEKQAEASKQEEVLKKEEKKE